MVCTNTLRRVIHQAHTDVNDDGWLCPHCDYGDDFCEELAKILNRSNLCVVIIGFKIVVKPKILGAAQQDVFRSRLIVCTPSCNLKEIALHTLSDIEKEHTWDVQEYGIHSNQIYGELVPECLRPVNLSDHRHA